MENVPSPLPLEKAVASGPVELLVTHVHELAGVGQAEAHYAVVARAGDSHAHYFGTVTGDAPVPESKSVFAAVEGKDFIVCTKAA